MVSALQEQKKANYSKTFDHFRETYKHQNASLLSINYSITIHILNKSEENMKIVQSNMPERVVKPSLWRNDQINHRQVQSCCFHYSLSQVQMNWALLYQFLHIQYKIIPTLVVTGTGLPKKPSMPLSKLKLYFSPIVVSKKRSRYHPYCLYMEFP